MPYRVGLPLWQFVGRSGVRLTLRVQIKRDALCHRYVAASPDLAGLVAEAATLEQLILEVDDCVQMLLEARMQRRLVRQPQLDFAFD